MTDFLTPETIPLLPAAALVVGFPLLLLLLTELINSGLRHHWRLTPTLRVVAKTDVTVVAFDAIQMAECLQRSTGLATEIGDAIDARRRAASAIRQRHSDQPS